MSKKKRFGITGATGFVGSYIARTLLKYYPDSELHCLKRKSSSLNLLGECQDKISWIEGDICDQATLEQLVSVSDIIIHSAGVISFDRKDKKKMYDANVLGTEMLVNLCLEYGTEKLIHLSSVVTLGSESGVYDEKKLLRINRKQAWYAFTKQLAEREVWRGMAEGLTAVVLNPPLVMGAGPWNQDPLQLFHYVQRGNPFYPTGSNGIVDVRDLAILVAELCQSTVADNQRIICSAANIQLRELADEIADQLGKARPGIALTGPWNVVLWGLNSILSKIFPSLPAISRKEMRIASTNFQYDNNWSKSVLHTEYRDWKKSVRETTEAFIASQKATTGYGIFPI